MNIIMFAVSALLAFFCCCSVTARPLCSSILPPDPPSTCAVLSPAAQIALKVSTRQGMLDLGSLLRNISATVTSRPDFTTWFMNSVSQEIKINNHDLVEAAHYINFGLANYFKPREWVDSELLLTYIAIIAIIIGLTKSFFFFFPLLVWSWT